MNINAALGMVERPLPTGIYYENKYDLRRVYPPIERDEVAELREKLADVTRELNQERSSGTQVLRQEREAYNEILAKLERVTRERDEAQRKYETQQHGNLSVR